jgi:sugar-specific transcriptional regulator TrmB
MINDKSELIALLGSLGLGHNEAATYEALLYADDHSSNSIRKIADTTGINRGTTYDALKKLTAMGLVGMKRRGSREQFTAESPEKIFDLIRDKRRDLLEADAAAKQLVPDLLARSIAATGQPVVRYYEGDEGVVTILKDVLQTCGSLPRPEYCAYSSGLIRHYLYRKFPQFTLRRIDGGIRVRVIAEGQGPTGEPARLSERKLLANPDNTPLTSYTLVYGDKVATISITDEQNPYGVVIEDKGAASMQRILFDQLWRYI